MCLVAQSCLTLCNPVDCSPPGSLVHGDSPHKNTGVGCHDLLQGIFLTQGLNLGLLHCWWILYHYIYICVCVCNIKLTTSTIFKCAVHPGWLPAPTPAFERVAAPDQLRTRQSSKLFYYLLGWIAFSLMRSEVLPSLPFSVYSSLILRYPIVSL